MASYYTRTENVDVLKTRRLIVQNSDGSYPANLSVPIVTNGPGNIEFSPVLIDLCGNVTIPGNLNLQGTTTGGGNSIIVSAAPTIIGSTNAVTKLPDYLFIQPGNSGTGKVSISALAANNSNLPAANLDVNGNAIIREGLIVIDAAGNFSVDGSGNVVIGQTLQLNGNFVGSVEGGSITGDISGNANSIYGTLLGSQITGDISGSLVKGDISGNANTLYGDLSGSKVQGDISGNAQSIYGDVSGSRVIGDISGRAFTTYGGILGSQITTDINTKSAGLSSGSSLNFNTLVIAGDLSGATVPANILYGYVANPVGSYPLQIDGSIITGTLDNSVLVNGYLITGDISGVNVTIGGYRVIGDISGNAKSIYGDVSGSRVIGDISGNAQSIYGDVSGSRVIGDISGAQIQDELLNATIASTKIVPKQFSSSTFDVSGDADVPTDLSGNSGIYGIRVDISGTGSVLFTTAYYDGIHWTNPLAVTDGTNTLTITLDQKKLNLSPTPSPSPVTTIHYILLVPTYS